MRIALVVDHPDRDLPGLLLVALRLCQRGVTCHLVPAALAGVEIGALAPDAVLLPHLRRPNLDTVRLLLDAGMCVGVLDTEGGVFPSLDHYASLVVPDDTVRRRISCFCSWGNALAAHLVREGWYRADQVDITGAPRFDFYVDPWRDVALKWSPAAQAHPKPLILINGNFSGINPVLGDAEQTLKRWIREGLEADYAARLHAGQKRALHEMVHLANSLAARFPEVTFVYRPHPFEEPTTYRDLLDRRPNLHLDKTGPVIGWILQAAAVVQRGCTTGIEARMAGRPSLSPTWIPAPAPMQAVESVSIQCASQAEMDAQVERCLDGGPAHVGQDAFERVIRDWFRSLDGTAHQRVASSILARTIETRRRVDLGKCRDLHFGGGRTLDSLRSRAGAVVRARLGLPATWSLRRWRDTGDLAWWDRSARHFDATGVRQVVDWVREAARGNDADSPVGLTVATAHDRDEYRFNYPLGRSVTVCPR